MSKRKSKVTAKEKRIKKALKEYQELVKAPTIEKTKERVIQDLEWFEKNYLDNSILLHKLRKMDNDYLTKKEISTLRDEVEYGLLQGEASKISFFRDIASSFNK